MLGGELAAGAADAGYVGIDCRGSGASSARMHRGSSPGPGRDHVRDALGCAVDRLGSADAGQWVADEEVDDAGVQPKVVRSSTGPGGSSPMWPVTAAPAPSGWARIARIASSA